MFTIGTDTEVFLVNDDSGEFEASCGKFGGTKDNPMQFEDAPEGMMFQEDNVTLEFNTPVAHTREQWNGYCEEVLNRVATLADLANCSISTAACVYFKKEALQHPAALVFGCEPDYNAWKMIMNKKPALPKCRANMRTAAGHIHVGTGENIVNVAQLMDLYLGVPSILLTDKNDRRKLYGKAGDMRPKPYGLEYRTLDNFWIFNKKYTDWVYTQVGLCLSLVFMTNALQKDKKKIITAIDKHDVTLAKELVDKYAINVPERIDNDKVYSFPF